MQCGIWFSNTGNYANRMADHHSRPLVLCSCQEVKKNRINTHTHFWESSSPPPAPFLSMYVCTSIVFTCPNKAIHVCDVIVVVAQIQFQKRENAKSKQKANDFQFIDCDVACRMAMMLNEIHIKETTFNTKVDRESERVCYTIFELPVAAVAAFFELTSFWLVKSSVDTINTRALLARVRCV